MHERGGVEHLEGCRCGDEVDRENIDGCRSSLHCPPPRDAEASAEALSSRQGIGAGIHEERRFGAEPGCRGSLRREEGVESLGNRFDGIRRGCHGPSLVTEATRRIV
ncbi:hypothetical protein GCM10009796_03350 [Microbacterium koreense]